MSNNDRLIETIEHYKRNIIRACPDNEQLSDPKKVVYCLDKLSKLPISVQLLQITGIGRTVNELRKFEGVISEKAKILVTSWKAVVKAEEDKVAAAASGEEHCGSDVDETEVNGHHDLSVDNSSASDNEVNASEEEDEEREVINNKAHSESEDEDLDKENEREESDDESEDERERRLKYEEEKKAYEEYLKAKRKKALNGHHKNNEKVEKHDKLDKHDEKRKSSEHKSSKSSKSSESRKDNGKEEKKEKESKDRHRDKSREKHESSKDKDKHKSSSDKSSRDKSEKDSERHKGSIDKTKSSDKDKDRHSKSSSKESINKYSEEIKIKKEKVDDGYEKYGDKRNGDKTSDKRKNDKKENGRIDDSRKDKDKNHRGDESRDKSSKDHDKSREKSKSSSHHSSSSKHREDKDSKRKHSRDEQESSSKRSKHDVKVKQEPVTSDEDSGSSGRHSNEYSSSRESSVSSSVVHVKKEKTESSSSSSQNRKHHSESRREESSEPKKKKIIQATDGGFGDALLSIVPTSKKSSKKKTSSSSSKKPHSSEQISSSPAKSNGYSPGKGSGSPSDHSRSISPLDLLSGNVKLEPLEKLDIASTLPEISPDNYFKPHLYQSDKTPPESSHDALCNIMTSKNQRTKVFSGSRVTLTKVPSLYDSCIRILQENIDSLEYTGGVPYDILKPVLERATAEQLYQLEHYNPYLMEDTGPHWEFHCSRDFRGKKLQEYETWRELYLRCMLEREKKLKEVRQTIAQSKKQSTPVRTTKLAYVDSSFVKPPRQVARQQARHGTGSGSSSGLVSNTNKAEVVAKATVGAYSSQSMLGGPAVPVAPVKLGNAGVSVGANNPLMKKKKAPLMMKALQSFKGIRKR
ncbi:hypothetical protein M8J76_004647 [Diaphorina citri]|nr:hypothetical protein M8J75_013776 [Diaphorina citri]KAI5749103.1 hypothetical protein M8J76_004647 [Diaphorina citri]